MPGDIFDQVAAQPAQPPPDIFDRVAGQATAAPAIPSLAGSPQDIASRALAQQNLPPAAPPAAPKTIRNLTAQDTAALAPVDPQAEPDAQKAAPLVMGERFGYLAPAAARTAAALAPVDPQAEPDAQKAAPLVMGERFGYLAPAAARTAAGPEAGERLISGIGGYPKIAAGVKETIRNFRPPLAVTEESKKGVIHGLLETSRGAMEASTPLVIAGGFAGPVSTVQGLAEAWLASKVGTKAAKEMGASPEAQELVRNLTALGVGGRRILADSLGLKGDLYKGDLYVDPEVSAATGEAFGGAVKGGVARTAEGETTVAGKAGPFSFKKTFGGKPEPAGPGIEPQTIQGEPGAVSKGDIFDQVSEKPADIHTQAVEKQPETVKTAQDIADQLPGAKVVNPGAKPQESIERKAGSDREITDASRAQVIVQSEADKQKAAELLKQSGATEVEPIKAESLPIVAAKLPDRQEIQVATRAEHEAQAGTHPLYSAIQEAKASGDNEKAEKLQAQLDAELKARAANDGQLPRGTLNGKPVEVLKQTTKDWQKTRVRFEDGTERDVANPQFKRQFKAGEPETKAPSPETKPTEGETRYKYGNTQAVIPDESEAGQALNTARARISRGDLAGDGKDVGGGNHVTVRYGIKNPEDVDAIRTFLSAQAPFEATLGKTDSFPPSESSDGTAPIIAPVEAPELHRINAEIEQHGEFAASSHPEYKPHATVAYVKPEAASRYTGMDVTAGKKFTVDSIAISKPDGSQEVVKLKATGRAPTPGAAPGRSEEPTPGVGPQTKELTTGQLPDYAKQAAIEDSMMRRTNEGGSISAPDPYAGVRWREETVPLESLKPGNEMLWGGGSFKPRGSVTKGPIVVNDRGEIIDGNNRAHEAIKRGDKEIKIFRAVREGQGETAPQGITAGTQSQPTPKPGAIAWDLDNSLAQYQKGDAAKDPTKIGAPIPENVALAKQQVEAGKDVWIHSARATTPETVAAIKEWTKQNIGKELPVTNLKHKEFAEFYDDRNKPLPSQGGEGAISQQGADAVGQQPGGKEGVGRAGSRGRVESVQQGQGAAGEGAGTPERGAAGVAGEQKPPTLKELGERVRKATARKAPKAPEPPAANAPRKDVEKYLRNDAVQAQIYTPGAVVPSYGGAWDKVLEFRPADISKPYPANVWSVKVVSSDADGNPLPGERPRIHSTKIDVRDWQRLQANNARLAGAPSSPESVAPRVSTAKQERAFPKSVSVPGEYGSDTAVKTPNGDIPAKYKIVEASNLLPSHDAETFAKNPGYPEGVQERAYHTSKEAQARVIDQAQKYDPAYTINTNPDAVNGPPVVTKTGVVLGGNSRAMATQRIYKRGAGDAYLGALRQQAQQFGLGGARISDYRFPVLVREINESPKTLDEARRLGSGLNKSMTGALGVAEKAVSAGKSITPETLQSIAGMIDDLGGDASIRDVLRDRGRDIIPMLEKDGLITARERPAFIDTATGGLSEEGKTFVERALRGMVVDDSDLMERAPKSILNKLDGSLADIVGVAQRTDEYNVLPILRDALAEHADIAARGSDVETHLAQAGMFGPDRNPAVDAIVRKLAGKAKEVKAALRQFTQDANFDKQGQSMLLVGEQPSPVNAFNAAFGTNLTEDQFQKALIDSIEKQLQNRSGTSDVSSTQEEAGGAANQVQQQQPQARSQAAVEPSPKSSASLGTSLGNMPFARRSAKSNAPPSGLLPGMESVPTERAQANAEAQGEKLTEAVAAPKGDISAAAGKMERESPLFGGTEAGGNQNLFSQEKPTHSVDASKLEVGDTFVDASGEPRRITEINGDKIRTQDGDVRTYTGTVEVKGELNSPRALLAQGGKGKIVASYAYHPSRGTVVDTEGRTHADMLAQQWGRSAAAGRAYDNAEKGTATANRVTHTLELRGPKEPSNDTVETVKARMGVPDNWKVEYMGEGRRGFWRDDYGSFSPKAVVDAVKAIDKAYDRVADAVLQKTHMGRAFPEVERADPEVARDLRTLAAAPQYYRAKADKIVEKITAGMSREQEKGFVLLADQASRDWLRENKPQEYQSYIHDPRITQALEDYKPYEEELRDKQKALGGPTIDEDYLRRVYAEHVAGIDKTVAKGERKTVNANRVITPQMANKKGRIASAEYYYNNGLHEFGPSFATRYVATNLKLAEHMAAVDFLTKATKIENRDALPETIEYNGETYFRPDIARLIKESASDSEEGKKIAAELGVDQLPKPGNVKTYELYDPTPADKSDFQAKKLAQKLQEAYQNASGTKFRPEDMDELLRQANAISYSNHALYAGPKDIVQAFQSGAQHVIPGWLRDVGEILSPISGMVRRQVIGLGFGIPHIKNILRRVMETSPGAQLDPRSYARAAKVLLSDELRKRGVKGVDDPTFDALLKHAGISDRGVESYKSYVQSNTDATRMERAWNVIKGAGADWRDFEKQWLQDIKAASREGALGKAKAVTTAIAGAVETPLRPLMFVGHHAIFGPGGIDQKSRLWLYGLIKSQDPTISDDQMAQRINAQMGRYNKASWTDFQRDAQPFTFFPGWDYSSVNWVLQHPLRTAIPAALLVLLANEVIHRLGKNRQKDATDMARVHVGNYSVSDNIFRERLAAALAGSVLRFTGSKLGGKGNEQALRDALSGVPGDARAFVNMANPLNPFSLTTELATGKELGTGQDIVPSSDRRRPGKMEKDYFKYGARKLFPAYTNFTNPQPGTTPATFGLHNLGTTVFKDRPRRRY